jgi:uridine kinase
MNNTFSEICERISSYTGDFLLIGIDGRCASGKTTLANALCEKFDCNLFHADDFFLPPEMRTAERLTEAGGNIHYERLYEEVIVPLLAGEKEFSYGVFSCAEGRIIKYNKVFKKKINIIEGSYSLHPYFGDIYGIEIFVDSDYEKRISRIKNRGQDVLAFINKWIPLEEAYFKEYNIIKKCDYIMKG